MKRLFALFIVMTVIICPVFSQKNSSGKVTTVVIDPGHGGDKPGAVGKHIQEKALVLQVAQKFGKLIADNYPDVNIIYTRSTDVDVDLSERAHMANRSKADLFISIHANSHKTTAPTGVETFVMGLSQSKANMEVAKKENADILLEDDYKENSDYKGFDPNSPESFVMFAMYQNANLDKSLNFAQFIQNQYKANIKTIDRGVKQAELFVLYKTTMPAVLTEIGFISNEEEETFMMSDEGQAIIAISLFNAFANYKSQIEGTKPNPHPVIDLPGYGKNKPTKEQLAAMAAEKAIADSIAFAEQQEREAAIAAAKQAKADSIAAVRAAEEAEEMRLQPKPEESHNGVTYRVQFYVSEKPLAEGAKELKGVTGYAVYEQSGTYRYTLGDEPNVAKAKVIQSEIRGKGFKDAFIIAFHNGKRISLQEARDLETE